MCHAQAQHELAEERALSSSLQEQLADAQVHAAQDLEALSSELRERQRAHGAQVDGAGWRCYRWPGGQNLRVYLQGTHGRRSLHSGTCTQNTCQNGAMDTVMVACMHNA